jgi:hypothetical protein
MKQPLTANDFNVDSLLRINGVGFIKIAEVRKDVIVSVNGHYYRFKDIAENKIWTRGLQENYEINCKVEVSHDGGKTWGQCYKEIVVT